MDRERLKRLQSDGEMECLSMCDEMPSGQVEVLVLREQRRLSTSCSDHWTFDSSGMPGGGSQGTKSPWWLEEQLEKS